MESVILAFIKEEAAAKIKRMLENCGIKVSGVCRSKAELMRFVSELDGGVAITGFKLPDATANEVYADLPESFSYMVIAPASQLDMINEEIFVLKLPANSVELASSVNILLKEQSRCRESGRRKQRKEDEKKLVEQAKLLLMERHMMTEEQAHRFIQKRSMDAGVKMVDTAKLILS